MNLNTNTQVLLVTGGYNNGNLSSTEVTHENEGKNLISNNIIFVNIFYTFEIQILVPHTR